LVYALKNIEKTIWCVNFQKYYERFISWLNEGDVVLEVGAATGEFTIPAAKKIGRDGLLFSFEADLRNFKCLTKNLKIKKLDNVKPLMKQFPMNREKNSSLGHIQKVQDRITFLLLYQNMINLTMKMVNGN